jgi:phosphoglucosamine mutase
MEALQGIVKNTGAQLGLAFDGDADRMLAVDERGEMVDGDMLMMIFAKTMKDAGTLNKDTLVSTVMSNLGLKIAAKQHGINLETTTVGDRYVLERMLLKGYNLGGEQSGHIIFLDDNTTGDGLLSALRLIESYKASGVKMSELISVMKPLPQVLINVRIDNTKKSLLDKTNEITTAIRDVEMKYDETGRILVRASGTEPLIRVMIEGPDQQEINDDADRVASLIGRMLG